jgi:hypothetical protein
VCGQVAGGAEDDGAEDTTGLDVRAGQQRGRRRRCRGRRGAESADVWVDGKGEGGVGCGKSRWGPLGRVTAPSFGGGGGGGVGRRSARSRACTVVHNPQSAGRDGATKEGADTTQKNIGRGSSEKQHQLRARRQERSGGRERDVLERASSTKGGRGGEKYIQADARVCVALTPASAPAFVQSVCAARAAWPVQCALKMAKAAAAAAAAGASGRPGRARARALTRARTRRHHFKPF